MKVKTLIGLGLLAISLSACGVREEESMDDMDSVGSTASLGNSAMSSEGRGNPVELTFPFGDIYTGFWFDDSDPSRLLRIALGDIYYHHQWFVDASTESGTDGLNCYRPRGIIFIREHGQGLRRDSDAELTESYFEITVENGNLFSRSYDSNGQLEDGPDATYTGTYRRVFDGLSAGGIQLCS